MHEELIDRLGDCHRKLANIAEAYGMEKLLYKTRATINDTIAALSQPAGNSGQLAGWQWVPVEPTPEMIDAARSQSSFPAGVYRAMLSAAPVAAPSGCADVADELNKLKEFKEYVHQRLDLMGVPVDPESPHKASGCRIGGRLDYVETAIAGPELQLQPCPRCGMPHPRPIDGPRGWLPIESAPKNKRIALGWDYLKTQAPCFGQWDEDQYAKKPRPFWRTDVDRYRGLNEERRSPPSHWMDITPPAPPEPSP